MPYFVCSFKLSTVTKYALFTYILDFHFSISAILFLLNIYVSTLQPMTVYVRFVTFCFFLFLNWNATKSMDNVKLNANHMFVSYRAGKKSFEYYGNILK